MRPAGSPEALERRRHKAISLLEEGWMPVEVARKLGVDRRSVRRWRAAFERTGEDGLAAKPSPGRPPKLDSEERETLEHFLLQGPRTLGYPTDLWTCARVAAVIRRKFKVRYHVDHIGRLLRSMGWTPQKPERRARERDEAAIEGWVKKEWPRIKKKRRG
jgi:transposase